MASNKPVKIDGNKAYFESPWEHKNSLTIVGVGKDILAFGAKKKDEDGETYIHFKKEQWSAIKDFIDKQIGADI